MTTPKIPCPKCGEYESRVTNTRPSPTGVYRRRECLQCGHRYSTEETPRQFRTPTTSSRQPSR